LGSLGATGANWRALLLDRCCDISREIERLKSYFELADEDDDSRRSAKVEIKTRTLDPALAETLPYILSLLGIAAAGVSLAMMDARIRRRRT
jgi:hypothetical protein